MTKAFRAELIDELLAGAKTKEAIFGSTGVLRQLTGALVERALRAELSAHLEEEREAAEVLGNRRNGSSKKTLQTEQGPVPFEVPRDREIDMMGSSVLPPKILCCDRRIIGNARAARYAK
jgi:putative transposase